MTSLTVVEALNVEEDVGLRFTDPVQHDYEVIKPVVLFAQSTNSRSREKEMAFPLKIRELASLLILHCQQFAQLVTKNHSHLT